MLIAAPAASAFTTAPVWKCRGSAAIVSVAGQNRVEPIVANGNINTANGANPDRAQCVDSETGAGNTPTQLGIDPELPGCRDRQGQHRIAPDLGRAIDQAIVAEGRVEDLSLLLGAAGATLGVGAANSTAAAKCVAGNLAPQFSGDSRVADLTLGGQLLPLDQLVTQLTNILNPILGALVEIKADERIQTADSLTINALHVKVIRGTTPLVDAIIGQAKVKVDGAVCDPTKQNDGSGDPLGQVCATGSQLDQATQPLRHPGRHRRFEPRRDHHRPALPGPERWHGHPAGRRPQALRRHPCLSGSGAPKFAIVGTNKADRITGSNIADRIIGLGGNDKLDGGRGNDCIEGRTGGDNISGALGNDKLYGSSGNDHLNGGPGNDYMSAGPATTRSTPRSARTRLRRLAVATSSTSRRPAPRQRVDCGTGSDDVARINNNERRRVKAASAWPSSPATSASTQQSRNGRRGRGWLQSRP